MIASPRPLREGSGILTGAGIGLWTAGIALVPQTSAKLLLAAPLAAAALGLWLLGASHRWLTAFFFAAILLPPLPLPGGDSGLSVAPFVAAFGVLAALLWSRIWRPWNHPVIGALLTFIGVLLGSVAFAMAYSGPAIAIGSFARVVLFCIGAFVFLWAYAGPRSATWDERRFVRYLFGLAVAAAVFACADFYFQFPAPAGFGDQYVWLQDAVLRRAQGLFYEASTLGNFCAFFIVMTAAAYLRPHDGLISRPVLLAGGLVLTVALVLSYSRASMLNVAVAVLAMGLLRTNRIRPLVRTLIVLAVAAAAIQLAYPQLSSNYWGRLLGSFSYFATSPDKVLSGRLEHWSALGEFIAAEPWHLVFGVGYKTLPYSSFIGAPVVADNTYLALLVETGILGFGSFLALNGLILRTSWRVMKSADPTKAFLGEWIFCFWCGQTVQMLSGDLITYWRVLPAYFWVLGAAARHEDAA